MSPNVRNLYFNHYGPAAYFPAGYFPNSLPEPESTATEPRGGRFYAVAARTVFGAGHGRARTHALARGERLSASPGRTSARFGARARGEILPGNANEIALAVCLLL
jgi:hypothetical protein